MYKCDFELLLRRPLREIQGRLLSLMHAGHIAHSLHFALGGPVTDEATYRAQHGKNLCARWKTAFMNRCRPFFPRRKPLFPFYHPRRAARGCGIPWRWD